MHSADDVLQNRAPWAVINDDCIRGMATLPDDSVHCVATSPPYFALRDYGVDGQIGLEQTPAEYVAKMVAVFTEVRRILHPSGVLWLNLGDSYSGSSMSGGTGKGALRECGVPPHSHPKKAGDDIRFTGSRGCGEAKPKDMLGIPWRVAFALQADGWYLRQWMPWVKRNPMPESVTDRPGTGCETVFLMAKSDRYFFDIEAVKRGQRPASAGRYAYAFGGAKSEKLVADDAEGMGLRTRPVGERDTDGSRNWRSGDLWFDSVGMLLADEECVGLDVPLRSYKGAHFATWPPKLVDPMILAGTSARGVCPHCGEPWRRVVKKVRAATRPGTGSKVTGDGMTDGNRDPERHCTRTETVGWEPGCVCGTDLQPGDLEVIESPTGERVGVDPSLWTGRAGMNRPRGDDEGVRPMTRYEQRKYAEQLRACPARESLKAEVGAETFAHYIRTDRSGARPIPADVLARWVAAGHLVPVPRPSVSPLEPIPAVVFDPFTGSGTTLAVAVENGRRALGTELNPDYLPLIRDRLTGAQPPLFADVEGE